MRPTWGVQPINVFSVQYRDISWHGNVICHLQASFILKNDTREAVKKQSGSLPCSNCGSGCLLAFSITHLQRFMGACWVGTLSNHLQFILKLCFGHFPSVAAEAWSTVLYISLYVLSRSNRNLVYPVMKHLTGSKQLPQVLLPAVKATVLES